MVDMPAIQQFADRIAAEFQPESVILFGSYADGTAGPDSDVDLMVVMLYQGKSWAMATRIRGRVRPPFPLDLIVRSPRQLRERLALGDNFLREITQHGKLLYEADHC